MIATSGDSLLKDSALEVYTNELLPMATLITPNLDEAEALSGSQIKTQADLERVAVDLAVRFNTNVLAKGGHLRGENAVDVLASASGGIEIFTAPYIPGVSTHGTGCTYSAAIAAQLASGRDLSNAVNTAKRFVSAAISGYFRWQGTDALNHFRPT